MNARILLFALCFAPQAFAGNRSGGSGAAAVTIPADIVSSGGGASVAGAGASAVNVMASLGGIGGTVVVAGTSNQQGYIPQIVPASITGFALWASQNIPSGQDATFNGDANRDGISNGVAYALGSTVLDFDATGQRFRIEYPQSVPADVDLFLERSLNLTNANWVTIVSWVSGAAPAPAAGIELQGRVRDPIRITEPRAYYRYRAVKR